MFEKASRFKLRFETTKGLVSVEDLWDLPLTSAGNKVPNLDSIAVALYTEIKNDPGISFVNKSKKTDNNLAMKLDIVRHIIDVRMAEADARAQATENASKRQRILEILNKRQDDALSQASEEDLRKMLDSM